MCVCVQAGVAACAVVAVYRNWLRDEVGKDPELAAQWQQWEAQVRHSTGHGTLQVNKYSQCHPPASDSRVTMSSRKGLLHVHTAMCMHCRLPSWSTAPTGPMHLLGVSCGGSLTQEWYVMRPGCKPSGSVPVAAAVRGSYHPGHHKPPLASYQPQSPLGANRAQPAAPTQTAVLQRPRPTQFHPMAMPTMSPKRGFQICGSRSLGIWQQVKGWEAPQASVMEHHHPRQQQQQQQMWWTSPKVWLELLLGQRVWPGPAKAGSWIVHAAQRGKIPKARLSCPVRSLRLCARCSLSKHPLSSQQQHCRWVVWPADCSRRPASCRQPQLRLSATSAPGACVACGSSRFFKCSCKSDGQVVLSSRQTRLPVTSSFQKLAVLQCC